MSTTSFAFPIHLLPLKTKSTKPVDFSKEVKKVLNKGNAYESSILEKLTKERKQIIDHINKKGIERNIYKLKRIDADDLLKKSETYISLLSGLIYPPSGGSIEKKEETSDQPTTDESNKSSDTSKLKHSIIFEWSSAIYNDTKNYPVPDASFELVNILFNIGMIMYNKVIQMVKGKKQAKEAYKLALEVVKIFKYLERASGEISKSPLNENTLPFDVTVDGTKALQMIMMAQAQEIAIFKALDDQLEFGEKANVVATLCKSTHEKYRDIHNHLEKHKQCCEYWEQFAMFKEGFYEAMSFFFSGILYNKEDKNGSAIKCMQHAMDILKETQKVHSTYIKGISSDQTACKEQMDWAVNQVNHLKDKYEDQNVKVYRDKIPDEVPSPQPPKSLTEPEAYELPKVSEEWTEKVYAVFDVKEAEKIEKKGKSKDIGGFSLCEIL